MKRNAATNACVLGAAAAATALLYTLLTRPARLRSRQVALITGGSSGLGLALAHRFAAAGLRLALAARDSDQLATARAEILASNPSMHEDDVLLVACDVSDKEQAAGMVRSTIDAFGAIDVLVNNAGIIEVGPALDQPLEGYERAMAVDFFGALYMTYAALPFMLQRHTGAVVNISSIGGKVAVPHLLPYVAAKFALTGFSEGLHAELRHKGIRVTTVCPGLMRTGGEAHAHFVGQVDKEKAWFQTSARTPGLSASVQHAAEKIFAAVNAGRAEITITPQAWLAARAVGLAPETSMIAAALVNEYLLPAAQGEAAGSGYKDPSPQMHRSAASAGRSIGTLIPKGTEITAFVEGDMKLDMTKFGVPAPAAVADSWTGTVAAPVAAPVVQTASLLVESSVPNCDIEIDGEFVGNTPSTLTVAPGKHAVTVKKTGYADWTRNMTVAAGSVRLSAEMVAK